VELFGAYIGAGRRGKVLMPNRNGLYTNRDIQLMGRKSSHEDASFSRKNGPMRFKGVGPERRITSEGGSEKRVERTTHGPGLWSSLPKGLHGNYNNSSGQGPKHH